MAVFSEIIIRCPLYPDSVGEAIKTIATSGAPKGYKGAQMRFQFALHKKPAVNGEPAELYSIAGFTGNPRLRVRVADASGALLMDSDTGGAVVTKDESCTIETWTDGTKQHFDIYFPETDTVIAVGTHFISISGPDGDVFGVGTFQIIDPGTTASASPTPAADGYYTKGEVASLISQFWKNGFNDAGQTFIIVSENGLKGRKLGVDNDGNPTDEIIDL